MTIAYHQPCDDHPRPDHDQRCDHHPRREGVIVTRIGHAEITVRPEPAASPGGRPVILVRIAAPMLDALSAAYLNPTEALAVAETLRVAAERARRG